MCLCSTKPSKSDYPWHLARDSSAPQISFLQNKNNESRKQKANHQEVKRKEERIKVQGKHYTESCSETATKLAWRSPWPDSRQIQFKKLETMSYKYKHDL